MPPFNDRPTVIAVINSTPDIVEMLRVAFEHAGFVVVSTFTHLIRAGEVDLEAFIQQHQPQAIVYDIAPPYATNWNLFRHLKQLPALRGRRFVVTSTNPGRLRELADVGQEVLEIVEIPYVITQLVETVAKAVAREPLNARSS
jgi:CheY-like chemotaxis protein